ncbi:hypothetical protein AALP_AA1G244000 [Arabis alpina]|uniref:MBD domain-containing protein n=1 Tax=Arabis alpina TaxID=50452 RepID=A0A087HQC6_ARAAL|nr:hypothetical protein AALP_AA1G244000 [Arabis alpina]
MSLLVVGNRHFSVSALRVILLHHLRLRNVKKETIRLVKKTCISHRFLDRCSLSIRIRRNQKKTKEKKRITKKTKGISGNETGRRRGRPRKIRNPSDVVDSVDKTSSELGTESSRFDDSGNSGKRKRGRSRKNQEIVNCRSEEIVNLENREGTMVDLTVLGDYEEDPYGEELRRITLGLKTKEEFLGFLQQLNGEWVNAGRKKKVVEACGYGGYLPRGWKLMLCIKKKASNIWLACRKYISPNGQEFETCKEVSTYLQSLLDSKSKNQLNALQCDNKTLGQPVMMVNESLVGNSDSIDLPDLKAETNQNLEGERTNSEVFEAVNGAENGDIVESVKSSSLVEKDDKGIHAAESLIGDNLKKRDGNMENLANSQAQSEEFIQDLPWTTEEIQRIWGSRNT